MSACDCVEGCQLADRFTPATRELMVFTKDPKRYFDLDAVRTETVTPIEVQTQWQTKHVRPDTGSRADDGVNHRHGGNPAGAPPLDWWQIPSPKPQPVTEYQGAPMTATFYVGDAIETMNKLPEKSVDLILTSPPFLALRSYLPADHPDKALEGGSQATPGAFIDWLIDVVEACDRVLAPHGSLCIELGDTYAGSGGAGGDYDPGAWRQGQPAFEGSSKMARVRKSEDAKHPYPINPDNTIPTKGTGWPLAKSLSLIPELFRFTLVYGTNPLTGRTTDRWRLRNVVRWVRPNPPVGALGDKFRPATSELMVFCKSAKRYFDLDSVRTPHQSDPTKFTGNGYEKGRPEGLGVGTVSEPGNPVGAPPLDWWNIPLLEGEEPTKGGPKLIPEHPHGGWPISPKYIEAGLDSGSRKTRNHPDGAPPLDWWNIPPGGYEGAHYAVMPPELCIKPIKAMSPERVCRQCGEPSRRIVEKTEEYAAFRAARTVKDVMPGATARQLASAEPHGVTTSIDHHKDDGARGQLYETTGFSDCGHDDWRPGLVLDPFGGSGTTALVATGHGRDCILIDLDERNYELALQRVGPFILSRAESV